MPIQLDTPIEIPAKTADKLWVSSFNVYVGQPNTPIRLVANVAPYVSSTEEIISEMNERIFINDAISASAEYPKITNALVAINNAVKELVISKSLF